MLKCRTVISSHLSPVRAFEKMLKKAFAAPLLSRKNDPGPRPHSWHPSKLTEEEPPDREATTAPVWQPKHEAR